MEIRTKGNLAKQHGGATFLNGHGESTINEEMFKAISDFANDSIVVADADQVIRYWNHAAEATFGYSSDEAIGHHIHELVMPDRFRKAHITKFNKYLKNGKAEYRGIDGELYARRRDGTEMPVEISLAPITVKGEKCVVGIIRDLTERKRTQEELKSALSVLQATLDATGDGILVVDSTGKISSFNRCFVHMWRIPAKIADSRDDDKALAFVLDQLSDPEGFLAKVRELYATPEAESFDTIEFKDGRVFERYSMPQRVGAEIVGRVWSFRDVTDQVQAKQELIESEKHLRLLIDSSPDCICHISLDGNFLDMNSSGLAFNELEDSKEIVGKSCVAAIIENRDKVEDGLVRAAQGETIWVQYKSGSRSGREIWWDSKITPVWGPTGKIESLLRISRDITDRKRAALENQRNKAHLESILNNSLDVIMTLKRDGTCTYANPRLKEVTGYSFEDIQDKHFVELVHEQDRPSVQRRWRKINKGLLGKYETRLIRANGTTMDCLVSHSYLESFDEVLVTLKDITERKIAEQELERLTHRDELILNSVVDGIFGLDPESRITFVNPAAEQMTGYTADELIGASAHEIIFRRPLAAGHEAAYPDLDGERAIRAVLDRGAARKAGDGTFWRKDGTSFSVEWAMAPIVEGKRIVGAVVTFNDITDRKRYEEELNRTNEHLRRALEGIIRAMALTVEARDPYTAGHQQRVANLACALAQQMELSAERVEWLRMAAVIHDIGKIHIPAEILSKPRRLTPIEFDLIKSHAEIGFEILATIEFAAPIAQIVSQHHERIDGSGYPGALKGDEILLEAKILAVADVVEAMASHRPYRPALGIEVALDEISAGSGVKYDPEVVDACHRLFQSVGGSVEILDSTAI